MSFGAPSAGQGRNPTKVRSRTLPGDSTLLEGRALTDCRDIIFKRIHWAFEVLDVEKLREFVAPAPILVRTAIMMLSLLNWHRLSAGQQPEIPN